MHRGELLALLDRLPLEPGHEATIGMSALHTLRAGIEVLDEILSAAVEPVLRCDMDVELPNRAVA